jgi:folylpolyglutamate synthase/dihydropteroate synthase
MRGVIGYYDSSQNASSEALPGTEPLRHSRTAERVRTVQLVFAAMSDKDHAGMLRELLPLAAGAHFCAVDSPRAAAPDRLASLARDVAAQICAEIETGLEAQRSAAHRAAHAAQMCDVHPSVAEALQAARAAAGADGTVLCCGSLYLVAEVHAAVRDCPVARMPSERL